MPAPSGTIAEVRTKMLGLIKGQREYCDKHTIRGADGSMKFAATMTGDDLDKFRAREADINDCAKMLEEDETISAAVKRNSAWAATLENSNTPMIPGMPDPRSNQFGNGNAFKSIEDLITEQAGQGFKDLGIKSGYDQVTSRLGAGFRFNLEDVTSYHALKTRKSVWSSMADGMKTTMTTTVGWPPFVPRLDRVELTPTQQIVIMDMIPMIPTVHPAMQYLKETTFNNNANTVAENALKPESNIILTPQNISIEVVAHLLRMTKQQMDDVPGFAAYIQGRGMTMLDLVVQGQLLYGDGNSPNLHGFNTTPGINVQAKLADNIPDAVYKLFTLIRTVGFAEPDSVVINPTDWQSVRLMKTSFDQYIWGHPSEVGPERLWAKPIVQTVAQAQGTIFTGAFGLYSALYTKGGVEMEMTNSDGDDFKYNRLATRIERRLGLAVYRPSAFGQVTGV